MNRNPFLLGALLLLHGTLAAQELTFSPYSRYALGDVFSSTTTRNASMGGIGIATDNSFSINRLNPASYADILFTTMDVSAFGQVSGLRSSSQTVFPITGGIHDAAFAFPSNKGPVLVMGFSPFTSVGYQITTFRNITIDDSTFRERIQYAGNGGLNQAFVGAAGKLLDKRLSIGANARFLFGNTRYTWASRVMINDSIGASGYNIIGVVREVYLSGWGFQGGITYQDTLRRNKLILWKLGAIGEYNLPLQGDLFSEYTNTLASDTLQSSQEGTVGIPVKFGLGLGIYRPNYWSVGLDFTYRNWSGLTYFGEALNLSREMRVAVGTEWTPDPESDRYRRRINYRAGFYYKQSYISLDGKALSDYGLTLGLGLPGSKKGVNRFSVGRLTSRVNLSAELGRRGALQAGQELEEWYAFLRLGFTINDRWFIRRVVD
jgi:hypothetical protein